MNILICSVGRRVKLIEYFKSELRKINGKVIAVDCDPTAAALYCADFYEVVPRIDHPEYIDNIRNICKKYKISSLISLIDPELPLLASVKEEFDKENIHVIVSDKNIIDVCFDKYSTFTFLQENEMPSVQTYIDVEMVIQDLNNGKISFPLIVKPRKGSASIGINKVETVEELSLFQNQSKDIIFQPFIEGEEFGIDCYIDLITNETTNIFIKRKITMRAGETDKSIAIKDFALKELINKLMHTLKPVGPIDIDCFKTRDGYIISEVNPRFGGGYIHAHEMGQNFVENIINNLLGQPNRINDGNYKEGSTLVKYDHCLII